MSIITILGILAIMLIMWVYACLVIAKRADEKRLGDPQRIKRELDKLRNSND